RAGAALRLLSKRDDDPGRLAARDGEAAHGGADPHGDERASVPVRDVSADPDGDPAGGPGDGEGRQVMTDVLSERELSRKTFLKGGGALVVGFSLAGAGLARKASGAVGPEGYDPPADQVDSWLTV